MVSKRYVIEIVPYLETHQELLEVVANSRGVLVPSLYATTGEFYLLEALGLGKPAILFNAGIHGEIIEHGKNGMISEIGDLDGFYANIQKERVSAFKEFKKDVVSNIFPEKKHIIEIKKDELNSFKFFLNEKAL